MRRRIARFEDRFCSKFKLHFHDAVTNFGMQAHTNACFYEGYVTASPGRLNEIMMSVECVKQHVVNGSFSLSVEQRLRLKNDAKTFIPPRI